MEGAWAPGAWAEQNAILADFNVTENNCVFFKSLLFWVSVRAAAYAV